MRNRKNKQSILPVLAGVVLIIIILFIMTTGVSRDSQIKVGLIITGAIEDDGWNGMHYQGVQYACDKLETGLLVKENVKEGTGACADAIHELVREGAEMIILSSYGYPSEIKSVIQDYPDIAFYGISAEYYADNMTSYFGRMYQARYLAGIVAGMKTENDTIGYVAAMPNSEVNRGINAFTLGVRSVNENAEVNVIWTGTWEDAAKERVATNTLIEEKGVDVCSYHQNQHCVAEVADGAGIYSIGYNAVAQGLSDRCLTSAVWNWDSLYFQIVREFLQGRANSVKRHWFGIDTGVVTLSDYSPLVEKEVRDMVERAKQEMCLGQDVFSGVIYDNQGTLRCAEQESISDEELLENMDWFVDGVVIYE